MKKTFNNRRQPEGKMVEHSTRFQGSFQNPDKEIIKKRGVKSPNLKEMPFQIKEGKTVRFFATEEKYKDYLKKQVK